jgi:auxin influx carrier (AUX1 LAX family)
MHGKSDFGQGPAHTQPLFLFAGNVFGVMPHNGYLKASIFLMLVHQAIAFALYFMPLCFIWEKIIGVHTKSKWIRIPARLPVCESIYTRA